MSNKSNLPAQAEKQSGALVPTDMREAIELSKMMSDAGLVPDHMKGKPANCLMVVEQSMRWKMSPFAVAQATSVIQGKLMYEGKLVAAVINASGKLEGNLRFEHSGEKNTRTCTVSGTLKGEESPRTVEVRIAEVQTNNGMWKKQPDQQLAYSGARIWARRNMPELMLGVSSPEEFEDDASSVAPSAPPPPKRSDFSGGDGEVIDNDEQPPAENEPQDAQPSYEITSEIGECIKDTTDPYEFSDTIVEILDRISTPDEIKTLAANNKSMMEALRIDGHGGIVDDLSQQFKAALDAAKATADGAQGEGDGQEAPEGNGSEDGGQWAVVAPDGATWGNIYEMLLERSRECKTPVDLDAFEAANASLLNDLKGNLASWGKKMDGHLAEMRKEMS